MCRPVSRNWNLPAAGLADEGDRLVVAEAAGVVLELLVEPGVPVGLDELLEDVADEPLLVLREEVARHGGLGGVPVVAHAGAQQAELRVHVVPRKADRLPLLGRERGVAAAPASVSAVPSVAAARFAADEPRRRLRRPRRQPRLAGSGDGRLGMAACP